ncbi:MAG: glycerophosphodiester phosphodiesterase [Clostridiales bacterium]|nr:glycerophosphodiester phosphodiesterase [Clostridiales bacterium]
MNMTKNKLIFAHRGASAYAPQNTLPAFKLAADMKAFGVELDVRRTKDNKIVVIHNDTINETSNGTGRVGDMTLAELRQYSFAANFADKYDKVDIPTLEEVYELLGPLGLYVNVELKEADTDFVHRVHDCTKAYGMQEKVLYSAFNHWALTDMLVYDSDTFVAPLYGGEIVKPADYAKLFGAKAIHPHYAQILNHPEIVARANELGVRIHPWTVDDPTVIKTLCDFNIGAIITNKPDVALEIANA